MPKTITLTKWTAVKVAGVIALLISTFFLSSLVWIPAAYQVGYEEGVVTTLEDVRKHLSDADIDFNWEDLGDGKYILTVQVIGLNKSVSAVYKLYPQIDLTVKHYRNGKLIGESRGAGVLTTLGKNWIEQQISGDVNATQKALYLADSNDATAPDVAWTALPSEITGNGLERQLGSYTSTGNGAWNVSKTKSVTGTQSTQLWGLHYGAYATDPNTLVAADSTPDQKNCINGDTLSETWQVTVT